MRRGETMDQWRARVIADHYCDHDTIQHHTVAVGSVTFETLRYSQSGTGVGLVYYLLMGNVLHVNGDYGFAIYRAGWEDLGDVAQSGYDYFCGKCEASEEGRRFLQWDPEVAFAYLADYLDQIGQRETCNVIFDRVRYGGGKMLESQNEWLDWLEHNGDRVFGCGWYELEGIGLRPALRCVLHLGGLQCALGVVAPTTGRRIPPDEQIVGKTGD